MELLYETKPNRKYASGGPYFHTLDDAKGGLVSDSGTNFRKLNVYHVAEFSLSVIGDANGDNIAFSFSPLQMRVDQVSIHRVLMWFGWWYKGAQSKTRQFVIWTYLVRLHVLEPFDD